MRILLATGAMYPEPGGVPVVAPHAGLAAADVAAALAAGWGTRRGEDVLTALPIPDGGPGTAQAIGAENVSARRALQAYSPLGEVREVDLLQLRGAPTAWTRGRAGRTWLLDAARLTALPADVELAAREAREGTTDGLGEALAQALALTGAGDTLVVGLRARRCTTAAAGCSTASAGRRRRARSWRGGRCCWHSPTTSPWAGWRGPVRL